MKRKIPLMGIAFAAITLLASCYPNEDIYYSDTDIAVTNFDDNFVFDEVEHVFFLDTVMHIVGEDDDPKTGPYDQTIKSSVLENLRKTVFKNGEIHVIKDSTDAPAGIIPDIVVTIAVLETDYYSYYSYPWYGYWGYWGWGWGWKSGDLKSANQESATDYYYNPWYPWYPGGGVTYSYTIGSVSIDLINYKDADLENKNMPVAWTGIVNGVRSNNAQDERTRIERQITQCFSLEQSPYLY